MKIIKKHNIANDNNLAEIIYMQTKELLEGTSLSLDQRKRNDILDISFDCVYKLGAIKYHYDKFLQEWSRRFDEINKQKNQEIITEESILAYELEAYIFQLKSCLDALVKILKPITGQAKPTYSNYGDDVVSLLRNNITDSLKPRTDKLIELITYHKERWIKDIIDIRDKLSHNIHNSHGLRNFFFLKTQKPGSLKAPAVFGRADARLLVEISWKNIRIFVIDFIALSLYISLPPCFEIYKDKSKPFEKWNLSLNNSSTK